MTKKQKKHLARIITAAVLLALVWFVLPLQGLYKVKVLDNALNIRETPSINGKIKGTITNHSIYRITQESYNSNDGVTWGKLYSGAGWISLGSKYVQKM